MRQNHKQQILNHAKENGGRWETIKVHLVGAASVYIHALSNDKSSEYLQLRKFYMIFILTTIINFNYFYQEMKYYHTLYSVGLCMQILADLINFRQKHVTLDRLCFFLYNGGKHWLT